MNCILTKRVKFKAFSGQLIDLPVDTIIYVDKEESIAYWEGHHFTIEWNEYTTMS